jgi:hypothetical protein
LFGELGITIVIDVDNYVSFYHRNLLFRLMDQRELQGDHMIGMLCQYHVLKEDPHPMDT